MTPGNFDLGILLSASLLCANVVILCLWWWSSRRRTLLLRELKQKERVQRHSVLELSRTAAARRFEIDWLLLTVHRFDVIPRAIELIRRAVGQESRFFACGVRDHGRIMIPATENAVGVVQLTSTGRQRLTGSGPLLLTVQDQEIVVAESHASSISSMWSFPVGTENDHEWLLVSHVPAFSGTAVVDRAFLGKLCRVLVTSESALPSEMHSRESDRHEAEELQLIRDMLQLRTLADEEYSTPEELLQESLARLALLTDFSRASIYVPARNGRAEFERWNCGGESVSASEALKWDHAEQKLLQHCRSQGDIGWMNLDGSHPLHQDVRDHFMTAVIEPLPEETIPGGVLLIVSRHPRAQRRATLELARWSGEFLLTSFERALSRLQMEDRARRDGLTRLANRQTFDIEIQKQWQISRAMQSDCSLLLIDVDHFKNINDTYGHPAGDEVLRCLARLISQTVQDQRVTDRPLVARYGGEEFAALLPDCSIIGAGRIAEAVRLQVEATPVRICGADLRITISVGGASLATAESAPAEMIRAADLCLYAAKGRGRNQVVTTITAEPGEIPRNSISA